MDQTLFSLTPPPLSPLHVACQGRRDSSTEAVHPGPESGQYRRGGKLLPFRQSHVPSPSGTQTAFGNKLRRSCSTGTALRERHHGRISCLNRCHFSAPHPV